LLHLRGVIGALCAGRSPKAQSVTIAGAWWKQLLGATF